MKSLLAELTEALLVVDKALRPRYAMCISSAVNDSLYAGLTTLELGDKLPLEVLAVANKIPVQPMSAALPWQALNCAETNSSPDLLAGYSCIEAILATIPIEYQIGMKVPPEIIAPHGSSLVSHVAQIIGRAEKDLLVVNPYWSESGIRLLSSQIPPGRVQNAKATIITPAAMKPDHLWACRTFKEMLFRRGFNVEHWTPSELQTGGHPLVHAKVIVADRDTSYLGSANLSENGLNKSIEIGLSIRGPASLYLRNWFDQLAGHFEKE